MKIPRKIEQSINKYNGTIPPSKNVVPLRILYSAEYEEETIIHALSPMAILVKL